MCIHAVACSRHLSIRALTNHHMHCRPLKPFPWYSPPNISNTGSRCFSTLLSLLCFPRPNSRAALAASGVRAVSILTPKQREMMLAWGGQTHAVLSALCTGQRLSPKVLWRLLGGAVKYLMADATASRLFETIN